MITNMDIHSKKNGKAEKLFCPKTIEFGATLLISR